MRKLFCTMILLTLAGLALAELPVPAVNYVPVIPRLEFLFTLDDYFPPVGFERWRVDVLTAGEWNTYYDYAPERTVKVELPRVLDPGIVWFVVSIETFGTTFDQTQMFDFQVPPVSYYAVVPRVAVDADWQTAIALTCHESGVPVSVDFVLWDESGLLVQQIAGEVPVHGSAAFFIGDHIEQFYGSAEISASGPGTYVYLCIGPDGQLFTFCRDLSIR